MKLIKLLKTTLIIICTVNFLIGCSDLKVSTLNEAANPQLIDNNNIENSNNTNVLTNKDENTNNGNIINNNNDNMSTPNNSEQEKDADKNIVTNTTSKNCSVEKDPNLYPLYRDIFFESLNLREDNLKGSSRGILNLTEFTLDISQLYIGDSEENDRLKFLLTVSYEVDDQIYLADLSEQQILYVDRRHKQIIISAEVNNRNKIETRMDVSKIEDGYVALLTHWRGSLKGNLFVEKNNDQCNEFINVWNSDILNMN